MNIDMGSLPPRLSDQQKYILAQTKAADYMRLPVRRVMVCTSHEFDNPPDGDTDGRRLVPDELMPDPEEQIERMMNLFDDPAEAQYHARIGLASMRERLEAKPTIKDTHRASVSRSLRRLEERELIDRETIVWRERDGERKRVRITNGRRTTKISLTEAGKEAGEEILRRISDGRYNLAYDTLSEDGVRI